MSVLGNALECQVWGGEGQLIAAAVGPLRLTFDQLVEAGEFADAHEPEIRREMARALARLIELASEVPQEALAPLGGPWWPEDGLWPPPHNALFDFEATAAGAGWIDEIAREAKRIVESTPIGTVVSHGDWSANQMRFESGKINYLGGYA